MEMLISTPGCKCLEIYNEHFCCVIGIVLLFKYYYNKQTEVATSLSAHQTKFDNNVMFLGVSIETCC